MFKLKYFALLSALITCCVSVKKNTCHRADYGGTVAEVLKKLPGLQQQQQINQLASAVEGAIADCMFTLPFCDDFEIQSQIRLYICAGDGVIFHLDSLKRMNEHEDVAFKENHDGTLEFTLSFLYTKNVNIDFCNFASSTNTDPSKPDTKGILKVSFERFFVDLILETDSSATVTRKVTDTNCILRVKEFRATLASPNVDIKADNTFFDAFHETKIKKLVLDNINIVEDILKLKVKSIVYEGLVMSGKWVCHGQETVEVMRKRTPYIQIKPKSETFRTLCPKV